MGTTREEEASVSRKHWESHGTQKRHHEEWFSRAGGPTGCDGSQEALFHYLKFGGQQFPSLTVSMSTKRNNRQTFHK